MLAVCETADSLGPWEQPNKQTERATKARPESFMRCCNALHRGGQSHSAWERRARHGEFVRMANGEHWRTEARYQKSEVRHGESVLWRIRLQMSDFRFQVSDQCYPRSLRLFC